MLSKCSLFLSTFFYLGKFKYAPGTLASLATLLLWFYFVPDNYLIRLDIILLLIFTSFITTHYSLPYFNEEDPQCIVIDEVLGMSIALFFIKDNFLLMIVAFILFRIFDISKPSLIYYSQNLKQAYGILMDDILAGLITALILIAYT